LFVKIMNITTFTLHGPIPVRDVSFEVMSELLLLGYISANYITETNYNH
jgi:hypothetical protein